MTPPTKNALEWSVFALSLALVATVGGLVVRGDGVAADGPPRLRVEVGAATPAGASGRMTVPVALVHLGGETVAEATVEVRAGDATATLTFGYLPRGTRQEGAVELDAAPDAAPAGGPQARLVGYLLP